MNLPRCENCRYWTGNEFPAQMQCRRHPPVLVVFGGVETGFPVTEPGCWCGEYRDREEAS